jgi:Steigviridae/Suoliviridae L,D-carboxypeptidase/transpeptidase
MNIRVIRYEKSSNEKATIGRLLIDDVFFCFTLEDQIREVKIVKETAIPVGSYEVVLRFSQHFKRVMPHIENVPNFEGILIHYGNTDIDTAGCILVGMTHDIGTDFIGNSRDAFDKLLDKLATAVLDGITILIQEDFEV